MDHESLRQKMMNYWIAYLSELRKEVPKYVSYPESKQLPIFFRTHRRYVKLYEYDDGYVVDLYKVPEAEFDQVGYWETFHVYGSHGQTVGAAMGKPELRPYGDFLFSDPRPMMREVESGEYADPVGPQIIEGREFISNNRIDTDLTEDMAREAARRELRDVVAANPVK